MFALLLIACSLVMVVGKYSPITSSRVEAILASMTLEEKVGQMVQIDISKFMVSGTDTIDYDLVKQWVQDYKIGSILNSPFSGGEINGVSGWTAEQYREMIINFQKITEETTSKVPIIYGIDSIHGATFVKNAALFPQALALAATFDTDMAFRSAQVSSRDTRAAGIQWLFAPVLGLGLHPNWARFPETFGEDPYLAAAMGKAVIDGIQYVDTTASNANSELPTTEGIPARAAACMKHFIAYSFPVNGHDRSPVLLPDRMVKQLYMPSFQAAIDTGVMTGMESYQEVGGEPMVSSKTYLKNLLRKEMKFEGMLVTDYMEIENLYNWHRIAESQKDAVDISMTDTTVDMSMVPLDTSFGDYLTELVNEGKISVERVEESARRVLQLKEDLGMLDERGRHFSPQDTMLAQVGQSEDWELSLDASRAALTLLKNDPHADSDSPVLPISNKAANIFVTGPTADSVPSLTGGWSIHWQGPLSNDEVPQGVSILQGIRDSGLYTGTINYYAGVPVDAQDTNNIDTDTVAAMASEADYIVVCVGEGTYAEKPGDIDDLALPQGQVEYVQQLAAFGKPVIMVMVSGRPRLLHAAVESSSAVLNAYVPGPKGGLAVAEALIGNIVPSGRLPFNYPRSAGDIPYAYHHKPGDQCIDPVTHAYIKCQLEWEFGAGLSYTTFSYSDLTVSTSSLDEHGSVDVSLVVQNTGNQYAAHDTVLLFLYDMVRRVTPEYKLLKRFKKVYLAPSESTKLTWTLNREDFKYVGLDSRYILESGEFRVGAGASVDCRDDGNNPLCASFQLQLTSDYQPVCDYACAMWAPSAGNSAGGGICGVTVDNAVCRDTCVSQKWSWNYVDCLEEYYMDDTCTSPSQLQCYSAFSTQPQKQQSATTSTTTTTAGGVTDGSEVSDCNDSDNLFAQSWFVAVMIGCVSVVALTVGAVLGGYFQAQRRMDRDRAASKFSASGVDEALLGSI